MKILVKSLLIIVGLLSANKMCSQSPLPFTIELETINISQLGGVQAYAFGQSDGKWLIVGGRLDGLHKRQPWASFDEAGHNTNLIVIDPINELKWSAPLSSLPVNIQEQLSSTNMQFYQRGDYLYCIGGYGYSATNTDHITYPFVTAIDVSNTINAIINNQSFTTHFTQIQDTKLQITGGKLKILNGKFYLMGGQKFMGKYNPMGPNNGPGFVQEYTSAIRVFDIVHSGGTIQVQHIKEHKDTNLLHRRDYNAEPQILSNGNEGLMMFSGVFRIDSNLPYTNTISIDKDSFIENSGFEHLLHHYHCPVVPIYSASNAGMYHIFFGGIAQFFYENGTLKKDDNVPFVKTISCVSRNSQNQFTETKLDVEMPELVGAAAEFIPNHELQVYDNDVIKYDDIQDARTLIGYIYGGISSTAANVFFSNGTDLSKAGSMIYKVYLKKNQTGSTSIRQTPITGYSIYPNPFLDYLHINTLSNNEENIEIYNVLGEKLGAHNIVPVKNQIHIDLSYLKENNYYILKFADKNQSVIIYKTIK